MFGPALHPGRDAVLATGFNAVVDRGEFAHAVEAFASDCRTIYTPFPEALGEASSSDPAAVARVEAGPMGTAAIARGGVHREAQAQRRRGP